MTGQKQTQKLDQYSGSLTPQKIADGMNAAASNARRLLFDAELLMGAKRYPSAVALAILAIEEAGKTAILRTMATLSDEVKIKANWREYRSHRAKSVQAIIPMLVAQGAKNLDDLRLAFDPSSEHPTLVDLTKQICLYTDCLGDAHWSQPEEDANEELASQFIHIAKMMVPKDDDHKFSRREIELWAEYMSPVMDKPLDVMKAALLKWHEKMRTEGLTDAEADWVERFVRGEDGAQ